jgi:hypothetical protein
MYARQATASRRGWRCACGGVVRRDGLCDTCRGRLTRRASSPGPEAAHATSATPDHAGHAFGEVDVATPIRVARQVDGGAPSGGTSPPETEEGTTREVAGDRAHLADQIACMTRVGSCPQTRSGGIPTLQEMRQYDAACRRETGYAGGQVQASELHCGEPGLAIALSLDESYPGWLSLLPDCPCVHTGARPGWDDGGCNPHYHPGAAFGYRSASPVSSVPGTAHGQQCCYTQDRRLIQSGPGAGTPDVWSPSQLTNVLRHVELDVHPWEALGWETYNRYWRPNQGESGCSAAGPAGGREER